MHLQCYTSGRRPPQPLDIVCLRERGSASREDSLYAIALTNGGIFVDMLGLRLTIGPLSLGEGDQTSSFSKAELMGREKIKDKKIFLKKAYLLALIRCDSG